MASILASWFFDFNICFADISISVACPSTPPRGWWIITSAFGKIKRFPFAPDESIPSMSRLLALNENAMLFLNEETVPRAGLRVQLTKQRVRWHDGTTHVWLGKKVLTGKGEGSSGLRFDKV